MRLFQRIAMLLLVGILLFTTYHHAFQTHFTASSNDLIHVQLLGINDLHGQLDQYQQLQGKRVGGAEYLASHLQAYQEKIRTRFSFTPVIWSVGALLFLRYLMMNQQLNF